MATNAKRLELLHFKKEPQIQPRKHFPKLGNPNPDHDVKWNYRFIEIVAPGSDAVNKGTTCGEILCVDVDEIKCDNGVENAAVERVTEDAGVAKEGNYDPAPQSEACVLDVSLNAENYETKSSFRVSFNEAPSLAESDLVCAREPVDMKSDGDEIMNENSPSSPAPDAPESGATLSGHASINGFSDSEIVDMDIEVDYVLYRGFFCPGCVVTFSCNGIKINGSITCGNLETLSLEKQIDDIVRIESWHVQSTKSVIVKLIISTKDASQGADACGTSGIEELEFAVVEPNWSEKRDKITSLNVKYLAVWSVIHEVFNSSASRTQAVKLHNLQAKNNAPRTGRRPVPVVVDVDLDSGRTNGLPQNNHNKRRRGLSTQTVTNCGPYINIDDSNSARRSTVQSRAPTPPPPPPPPPPTEPIFSCPICMGPFAEATATKCGHIFCLTCIMKALATAKSPTCPTCRNKVSKRGLIRVFLPSTS